MKSTDNSAVFANARSVFRRTLQTAKPDPELLPLVEAAFAAGKSARSRGGVRVRAGSDVDRGVCLCKFYKGHRYFNRWRPSRARLAWAAGRTLAELGIPTVEVVGFVERSPAIAPFESCLVMRPIPDAITLRKWIWRHHGQMDEARWAALRERVCACWLRLGAAGVYHDDTKALNLLTSAHADPIPDRFVWIDLESVHPGIRPSRRRVLRNLVQLNGSLRKWVPEIERRRFLEQAAAAHPWLLSPWVKWYIRHRTRKRLLREVRTRCGP